MSLTQSFRISSLAIATSIALASTAFAAETNLEVKSGQPVLHAGDAAPAYLVKVAYPDGRVVSSEMLAGERIAIDPRSPGAGYAEGYYQVELSPIMGFAKRSDESTGREQPKIAAAETITRGFRVVNGTVYVSTGPEPAATSNDSDYGVRQKDQVFTDDLIVTGSGCIGTDCVNNESFGFDTLRLKENNLRINFDDTSNSGSFPSNDWRIVANDSNNGGTSYLAIEDSTAGRIPFRVVAGARANALYVDSSGRVGFGTSTPSVDIHDRNGNTPTLRLEQDGSSGFTSQTWDVGGNEANFFIRDVTNGSKLAFRIKPGSPESSVHIFPTGVSVNKSATAQAALDVNGSALVSGKLGVGTAAPVTNLDVLSSIRAANTNTAGVAYLSLGETFDGSTPFFLQRYGSTHATLPLGVDIWNADNGFVRIATSNLERVRIDPAGNVGIGTDSPTAKLHVIGDVIATGAITQSSDRNAKSNIVAADVASVLEKIARVPIALWTYKNDHNGARHLGPMAQDFYAQFGLGADNRVISPLDVAGVAIASIQALNVKLEERDAKIEELEKKVDVLIGLLTRQAEDDIEESHDRLAGEDRK